MTREILTAQAEALEWATNQFPLGVQVQDIIDARIAELRAQAAATPTIPDPPSREWVEATGEWIDASQRAVVPEVVAWLWCNFVDGKPEYWAFDNPYPCHEGGDPMTLGEPCGYAIVKQSKRGRPDVTNEQVMARLKPAAL